MARDALQVDTQKHSCRADGQLVVSVLGVDRALVRLVHVEADQKVDRGGVEVGARRGSEQAANEFIVGLVGRQRRRRSPRGGGCARGSSDVDPKQIGEEVRPAVQEGEDGFFVTPFMLTAIRESTSLSRLAGSASLTNERICSGSGNLPVRSSETRRKNSVSEHRPA